MFLQIETNLSDIHFEHTLKNSQANLLSKRDSVTKYNTPTPELLTPDSFCAIKTESSSNPDGLCLPSSSHS